MLSNYKTTKVYLRYMFYNNGQQSDSQVNYFLKVYLKYFYRNKYSGLVKTV